MSKKSKVKNIDTQTQIEKQEEIVELPLGCLNKSDLEKRIMEDLYYATWKYAKTYYDKMAYLKYAIPLMNYKVETLTEENEITESLGDYFYLFPYGAMAALDEYFAKNSLKDIEKDPSIFGEINEFHEVFRAFENAGLINKIEDSDWPAIYFTIYFIYTNCNSMNWNLKPHFLTLNENREKNLQRVVDRSRIATSYPKYLKYVVWRSRYFIYAYIKICEMNNLPYNIHYLTNEQYSDLLYLMKICSPSFKKDFLINFKTEEAYGKSE